MNLEKVVFGFFTILACTLNFGFFIGEIGTVEFHHPGELFAAIVVNLVALVLKFGDRTHIGATHLATSLVSCLQLIAGALVGPRREGRHDAGHDGDDRVAVGRRAARQPGVDRAADRRDAALEPLTGPGRRGRTLRWATCCSWCCGGCARR